MKSISFLPSASCDFQESGREEMGTGAKIGNRE